MTADADDDADNGNMERLMSVNGWAITENRVEKGSDSDTRTTLDNLNNNDAMIDDDATDGMRSKLC